MNNLKQKFDINTKEAVSAGLFVLLLGLGGFLFNPSPKHNPKHKFSFEAVVQDTALSRRQYGEIRYKQYLKLIEATQKEYAEIKVDTLSHPGYIQIFMEEENSTKSDFNASFFNKVTANPYPDLTPFKKFLEDSLDMHLAFDPELYGFELKIREKEHEDSRYLLIPYQMLIGLLSKDVKIST